MFQITKQELKEVFYKTYPAKLSNSMLANDFSSFSHAEYQILPANVDFHWKVFEAGLDRKIGSNVL